MNTAPETARRQITRSRILERGWTPRMVEALLGEPDEYAPNPKYRSAAPCRLYTLDRIQRVEASPEYEEMMAQVLRRRQGRDYTPEFARKYGQPSLALADAAECLFSLNRYAKHDSCSASHREQIYRLKNEFVRALFERGLCTGWCLHELVKPEKELHCYCTEQHDDGCPRCEFTGIYRTLPPLVLEFIAFRFVVSGKPYSWHQPRNLVTWDCSGVAQVESADPWTPEGEKPIALSVRNFARAKALLRWVLGA